MKVKGNSFYGTKISNYGIEKGYVDYETLASSFDAVLCNDILYKTRGWDIYNGPDEPSTQYFQYFIISKNGADILEYWTNELVLYNEDLNIYLWCIDHFGTSWDYVLTDIEIELDRKEVK